MLKLVYDVFTLNIKSKITRLLKLLATVVSLLGKLLGRLAGHLASPLGHLRTRQHMRHSPRLWRRRRVGATVLLITLMVAMGFLWYYLADERIKNQAEEALERLTGGDAVITSASLSVLRNITIKGLKIYLPNSKHKDDDQIGRASCRERV